LLFQAVCQQFVCVSNFHSQGKSSNSNYDGDFLLLIYF